MGVAVGGRGVAVSATGVYTAVSVWATMVLISEKTWVETGVACAQAESSSAIDKKRMAFLIFIVECFLKKR